MRFWGSPGEIASELDRLVRRLFEIHLGARVVHAASAAAMIGSKPALLNPHAAITLQTASY